MRIPLHFLTRAGHVSDKAELRREPESESESVRSPESESERHYHDFEALVLSHVVRLML